MTEVDSKEVILRNAQTDLMDHGYARHTLHPVAAAGDHVLQSLCGVAQEKVRDLTRVNAWYSGPIFRSQCFFSIPHCIARSIKNTLDTSSTF
jgi:hypothetical protein